MFVYFCPRSWLTVEHGIIFYTSCTFTFVLNIILLPLTVAARSKACVCGRSLAGIVGFESHRGHGCLSLLSSVVCCQVEVSSTVLPRVMSLTECDLETSTMRRPRRTGAVEPRKKKKNSSVVYFLICFAYKFSYLLVFPFLLIYNLRLLLLIFAFVLAYSFPFSWHSTSPSIPLIFFMLPLLQLIFSSFPPFRILLQPPLLLLSSLPLLHVDVSLNLSPSESLRVIISPDYDSQSTGFISLNQMAVSPQTVSVSCCEAHGVVGVSCAVSVSRVRVRRLHTNHLP